MAWEVPEAYRKRLSLVASGRAAIITPVLSLPLMLRWERTIFPALSTPLTKPNMNLHWFGEIHSHYFGYFLGPCSTQFPHHQRCFW